MGILNTLLGKKDIEVAGNMIVKTLKSKFEESFGTKIRVYSSKTTGKGAKLANDKATLASICAEGMKVKPISIKKSHTVGEIEDQFKEKMGIGIQIMMPDGKSFAPNDVKLKDVVP
jgi:hypothetical protein